MTPLTPLDIFRAQMGMHPWHFWQLANSTAPVVTTCNDLVYQYAWQGGDAAARTDVALALESAEEKLREYLGYAVAPRYVTETLPWPQYLATGLHAHGYGAVDGHWQTVQLREGEIQAAGVESLTLIGTAAVAYSDADGDGLDETFTVTIATAVTDASQIAVYFVTADRLESAAVGDAWRIRPVNVTISGGTATITGRSWLLVKPIKYEGVATATLDPDTASNLAATLAVYQRTTNTDTQATLIWDTLPWPAYACGATSPPAFGSPYDPAATATAVARVGITDARRGIVHPAYAVYDAATATWSSSVCCVGRLPDRVTVRYLAGKTLLSTPDGAIDPAWARTICAFAAAECGRPICACQDANRKLFYWQTDLARTGGNNDEAYGAISADDLNNPFGTRRGHVHAWRHVQQYKQQRGVFAG